MLGYNLFALLACLAAILVLDHELRLAGLWRGHAVVLPVALLVVTRIGSFVLFGLETGGWRPGMASYLDFRSGGMSFYGGFYPAMVVVALYATVARVPILRLLDLMAPGAAVAFAVGRLGCLAAGCCRGGALPAGWQMPSFLPRPHLVPVPLLSTVLNAAIALLLLRYLTPREPPGRRFGWLLLLFGGVRFILEFIRTNPVVWSGLTTAQILSIPLVLVGAMLTLWRRRS